MSSKLLERLQQRSLRQRKLVSCTFELTTRCVFACQMCGFSMTPDQCKAVNHQDITLSDWQRIALQLKEMGVLFVTLTGGEPLLFHKFRELYTFLVLNGFRVAVKTNGYLVEQFKDLFRQYPPSKAYISVYGMSDDTYETVTGVADGFTKAMDAISFFGNERVPVQTAFVALRTNFKDKAQYDAYIATHPPGVISGILTNIHPHVVDHAFSNAMAYRLSPAERVAFETTVPFDEKAYETLVNTLLEKRKSVSDESIWGSRQIVNQQVKLCISAQNSCFFGSDGKMRFCQISRFSSSEPLKVGVKEAWQQIRDSEADFFGIPDKCRCCLIAEHCSSYCPARGYIAKHDVTQLPDDACEYTILKCIHKGIL